MALDEIALDDVVILTNEQFPEGIVGHVRDVGFNHYTVLVCYIKKDNLLEEDEDNGDDGTLEYEMIDTQARFVELYPEPRFVRVLKKGDQVQIANELLVNFTLDMFDYLNRIVTIDSIFTKGESENLSEPDKIQGFRILEDDHEYFWNIENIDVPATNRLLMKKEGSFTSIQNPHMPSI